MTDRIDDAIQDINVTLDKLDKVKQALNDKIAELSKTKSTKVDELKKLITWALNTEDENVAELRNQWLMASKLIYDNVDDEAPESNTTTTSSAISSYQSITQADINALFGYVDDPEDDDLAAEWAAMLDN